MNILITDKVDPLFMKLLKENKINYEYNISENRLNILSKIENFDGLVVRNRIKIDETFLNTAKHLKFIARYGSGMESIDIKKAQELNIICFNSAEGNANSVAEHTMGMLLSLLHNIKSSMDELNKLVWNREENRALELEGKTIGVIGYGHTGSAFSQKLKHFNCSVIAYDKYRTKYSNEFAIESTMEKIYSDADIISLHVPLTQETYNLVNKDFISNMKKPFYLLNTSRGSIVSTQDLISGLKEKKILGAGLDVIENEDCTFNDITIDTNFKYLLNCKNVILTPHIAGLSKESNTKLSKILINKILALS